MRYLPHAVAASTGGLYGTTTDSSIVDLAGVSGRDLALQYAIYLTVDLVGLPKSKILYGVRYLGPLQIVYGTTIYEAYGDFDKLFTDLFNDTPATFAEAADKAQTFLSGRVVNPINVGGRWIVR